MKKRSNRMLLFVMALFLGLASITAANVYVVALAGVHLRSMTDIVEYSQNVHIQKTTLLSKRGEILDRNGVIIAEDVDAYDVYAVLDDRFDETYVTDIEGTASKLAVFLHAPIDYIRQRLNLKGTYQTYFGIYGRNLTKEKRTELEALKLSGIKFTTTVARNYPLGTFAAHLIGFAQANDPLSDGNVLVQGKMGLELAYEKQLVGVNGKRESTVDRFGYVLPGSKVTQIAAVDGNNVTLTLDQGIQEALEAAILSTRSTFDAPKIMGSVMEIDTGKVLAWGQWPNFNPNQLDIEDYMNLGMQYAYEPGSTMKTFVYAAAIDTGVYSGSATFDSAPFRMGIKNGLPTRVGKNDKASAVINNSNKKNWGIISYDMGYVYSANVGIASLLTSTLSPQIYRDYLDKFAFFQPVSTDRLMETTGSINFKWPIEKLTAGYGQGVTVTMLQMLQAYSAVLSDGTMVKPYFVQKITNPQTNTIVYEAQTTVVGNPIKKETALRLQNLMYQVVYDEKGSGRFYKIPEVNSVAKTGTAEFAENGVYNPNHNLFSIMMGLPAEDPKIMIYYAFEAKYARQVHSTTAAIQQLMRKITLTYGFTKPGNNTPGENKPSVFTVSVPILTNHSVAYAKAKCAAVAMEVVQIGDGATAIAQYPLPNTQVLSNQRVLLLTSQANITMPNMTGWSRKDVLAYFALTHIPVSLSGEGNVAAQSVAAGTLIDASMTVKITLK
ncbi:MAG: penicillin-binding transpeptidase domain-containing protein [Erysipelotrichaceae bacterium]